MKLESLKERQFELCKNDFNYFILKHCPTREGGFFVSSREQENLIQELESNNNLKVWKSRQVGVSSIFNFYSVWESFFHNKKVNFFIYKMSDSRTKVLEHILEDISKNYNNNLIVCDRNRISLAGGGEICFFSTMRQGNYSASDISIYDERNPSQMDVLKAGLRKNRIIFSETVGVHAPLEYLNFKTLIIKGEYDA